MTKLTLPILILIMLVISPLFFSVTELNGDDERVLINDLQISQQVDCTIISNINCRIDRVVYEGLTYREIFEDNNLHPNPTLKDNTSTFTLSTGNIRTNEDFLFDGFSIKRTNSFASYTEVPLPNGNYYISVMAKSDNKLMRLRVNQFGTFTQIGDLIEKTGNNAWQELSAIRLNDNYGGFRFEINTTTYPTVIFSDYYLIINLSIFTTEPTQQQLDQWLEYYLQHKDQGIINDYYHIQSDTLINMSHQAYNGIDNLIVRTNNFIDWLTLDVASLLSRSIGFLGDKTYEILDDVGIISNDFTWWADFNDSLPTWLKRLVGLE